MKVFKISSFIFVLLSSSYSSQAMDIDKTLENDKAPSRCFTGKEYGDCIKTNLPLPGLKLQESYERCYGYFLDQRNQADKKKILEEFSKGKSTLDLAEVTLKLAQTKPDLEIVIQYLKEFLELDFKGYFEQLEKYGEDKDTLATYKSYPRYATIYQTMLMIELEKQFPGTVQLEEFENLYNSLSQIESPHHTAIIPLYMAHLIVRNNVNPNNVPREVALTMAWQLICPDSSKEKKDKTAYGKLLDTDKDKQHKPLIPEISLIIKPSMSQADKQELKIQIGNEIIEKLPKQQLPEQHTQNKKRKLVIESDHEDSDSEENNTSSIVQPNNNLQNPVQIGEPQNKKRKLVIDSDRESSKIEQDNLALNDEEESSSFPVRLSPNLHDNSAEDGPLQKSKLSKPRVSQEEINTIITLYQNGTSLKEIRKQTGRTYKVIYEHLARNNIPFTRKEKVGEEKIEKMNNLFTTTTLSVKEIAEKVECDEKAVYYYRDQWRNNTNTPQEKPVKTKKQLEKTLRGRKADSAKKGTKK